MADKIMEVVCDACWIRSGPGTNYSKLTTLKRGDRITVTEEGGTKNYWKKCLYPGWVRQKQGEEFDILRTVSEPTKDVEPEPEPEETTPKDPETSGYVGLQESIDFFQVGVFDNNISMKNLPSILGLPYQFLPSADTRIDSDEAAIGRKYAEKIAARIPLLILTPGDPVFMSNYSKQEKFDMTVAMRAISGGADVKGLDSLLSQPGRYYAFKFNHNEYYNYVNGMLRILARFMGLQNETLNKERLDLVNWGDYTSTKLNEFSDMGILGAVPFYIHSETQISENFSNSTTQSMLAGLANSGSDMGREINFLIGYGAHANGLDINGNAMGEDIFAGLPDSILNVTNKSNVITNVMNNLSTLVTGAKMIFPEIWSDSTFSRSYDIQIKLTTPDCDKLSWFFNIGVPMIHLIAMAAPRSTDNSPNAYKAPFLIRGFYKGLFNCDMGIITNMSITKGQEGAWTREGLPTIVDINFTLKDLYSAMSITSMQDWQYDTMNNTALMDYLANMAGINVNKPDILRQIDMWFTQNFITRPKDAITKNFWGNIEQSLQNKIMGVYRSKWLP